MNKDDPAMGLDGAWRHMLEQSAHAVVVLDDNGICFYNDAAQQLWGFPRADIIGTDGSLLAPLSTWLDDDEAFRAHGQLIGGVRELAIKRNTGEERWVRLSMSRVHVQHHSYRLALLRDVSAEVAQREEHRLLVLAIDHSESAMMVLDEQRRVLKVNRAFTELLGYSGSDVRERPALDFLQAADSAADTGIATRYRVAELLSQQRASHDEVLILHRDGRELWLRVSVSPVALDAQGAFGHAVVALADVTERRLIEGLQREVLAALTSALSFEELGNFLCRRVAAISPELVPMVLRVDDDNRLRAWASAGGVPMDWLPGEGVAIGEGVGSCGTAASRGQPVLCEDIATHPYWVPFRDIVLPLGLRSCWSYPILRRDGSVAGSFALYSRTPGMPSSFHEHMMQASVHLCTLAIEREESQLSLARAVQMDALTGLPNRTHLLRHVATLSARDGVQPFALMCVNVVRFRDINVALGHMAGDAVLVRIAHRLRSIAQGKHYIARVGADKFAFVLESAELNSVWVLAREVERAIARPIVVGEHDLRLVPSIGITHYPDGGSDSEALLSGAMHALQRAKSAGGGIEFFHADANAVVRERLLMGAALKRGLLHGELRLEYQPQVCAVSGRVQGFEALARWHSPSFGHVSPGRFIGLAEEIGIIGDFGRWALEEVCRQAAVWRREGLDVPMIAVNLSPLSFREPDLAAFVRHCLVQHAMPGENLRIEITESAMMALTPDMTRTMREIRDLGVTLSIDDFGTGFSSLSNLIHLPLAELKIDRSFVEKCLDDARQGALVQAMLGIGRSLGLTTVAEGVETQEQCEHLAHLGCSVIQGYYVAKSLSADSVVAWAADWRARSATVVGTIHTPAAALPH